MISALLSFRDFFSASNCSMVDFYASYSPPTQTSDSISFSIDCSEWLSSAFCFFCSSYTEKTEIETHESHSDSSNVVCVRIHFRLRKESFLFITRPLFDNINLKKRRMNNSIKHRNHFLLSPFWSHRQAITNREVLNYTNTFWPSWQTAWGCSLSSVKWASKTFCEQYSTFRIPVRMQGKPSVWIASSDFHLENLHCYAFDQLGSFLFFLLPASMSLEPFYF